MKFPFGAEGLFLRVELLVSGRNCSQCKLTRFAWFFKEHLLWRHIIFHGLWWIGQEWLVNRGFLRNDFIIQLGGNINQHQA